MTGAVLTPKEELKNHLAKQQSLLANLEKAQAEYVAFNKMFEAWLEGALQMTDKKGTIHLAEILTAWEKVNG